MIEIPQRLNEKEIRECYKFLNHLNETEIRIIDPSHQLKIESFFVHNEQEFVDICKKYNGKYNLYTGINERQTRGTFGKDVISIQTVVVDIDAIREKGFEKEPATEQELKQAEKITDNILEMISIAKHSLPVKLCSGNGYQLWFAIPKIDIDDSNRKEIENKIQLFQDRVISKFDVNGSIDKIGDLPRIIKIWGTLNIKGHETSERPFRIATVIGNIRERIENSILKKQILGLEPERIPEYEFEKIDDIDFKSMPPCINYLLEKYENNDGKYWFRIIQFLTAFFMCVGLPIEKTARIIYDWNKRQKYHESEEETEIEIIINRIYSNHIKVANCEKIKNERGGFPYFGLADLSLCKPDEKCSKCINPIIRYKRYNENKKEEKDRNLPKIELPEQDNLASEFAENVGNIFKNKNILFFRPTSKDILEILTIKKEKADFTQLSLMKTERFITFVERYFTPIEFRNRKESFVKKSMGINTAKILLESQTFQDSLPRIMRIFYSPIPIIYENKLTFPKKGYDSRFECYTLLDSPEINPNMTLDEAKQIIKNVYNEFCFEDRQDFINAIAGLLTPFLRGIFPAFNIRTPLFVYIANRARAGKDYCANITGIVHEGLPLEETPISTGDFTGNNNDELRKKILSAMIAGRKRLHFANNRGKIDNAVFEALLTNRRFSDRALGKNDLLFFDNEIDYSISGNAGFTYTNDFEARSIFVNFLLPMENPNSRRFERPNLHEWVTINRNLILSALFALVRNWFEKGKPIGRELFNSYPEWAEICGGVMEAAGYENPCVKKIDFLKLGGDVETKEMKILFEEVYAFKPEEWVKRKIIRDFLQFSELDVFSNWKLNEPDGRIKFGIKLTKYIGREFSGIFLKVRGDPKHGERQELLFTKEIQVIDKSKIFDPKIETTSNISLPTPPTPPNFQTPPAPPLPQKNEEKFAQSSDDQKFAQSSDDLRFTEMDVNISHPTPPTPPNFPSKSGGVGECTPSGYYIFHNKIYIKEGSKDHTPPHSPKHIFFPPDLKKVILILQESLGKLIPKEEIYKFCPIDQKEIDHLLESLKQEGSIFEPREGYVQLV